MERRTDIHPELIRQIRDMRRAGYTYRSIEALTGVNAKTAWYHMQTPAKRKEFSNYVMMKRDEKRAAAGDNV